MDPQQRHTYKQRRAIGDILPHIHQDGVRWISDNIGLLLYTVVCELVVHDNYTYHGHTAVR